MKTQIETRQGKHGTVILGEMLISFKNMEIIGGQTREGMAARYQKEA